MENKFQELELIEKLLSHPAGFDIGCGGWLTVRRYEHPCWAVEWEIPELYSEKIKRNIQVKEFDNPLDAAKFFLEKKNELKVGLDYFIDE